MAIISRKFPIRADLASGQKQLAHAPRRMIEAAFRHPLAIPTQVSMTSDAKRRQCS